jgi:hypothetical protein
MSVGDAGGVIRSVEEAHVLASDARPTPVRLAGTLVSS